MAGFSLSNSTKYAHSPVHHAVVSRDYAALKKILSSLPKQIDPAEIVNEAISAAEEKKADAISALIDRRDVPNRDTPLHIAVKMGDEAAVEMLMAAGADWSLQNEQGWSALQEAICNREEGIAMVIVRHYQPLAWAKWRRRLPRLISAMRKMRDFYMEITFHFESSVVPFVGRIAPSDTYKIWKRGANLRADMTLAGFDGFRIQRADQSILFLGDGSEDGKLPSGSLIMVSHKDKEVMNALDGGGAPASEAEVKHEVTAMSQTNIFRPGIDVTQAVLLPQMTWRRQEKIESVGSWKAKVYDMHNVVVSIKSRKVPGAMNDEDFMAACNENETESEELDGILTEDERKRLEAALSLDPSESENPQNGNIAHRHSCYERSEYLSSRRSADVKQEKKGWFSLRRKPDLKQDSLKKFDAPRSSVCIPEKVSNLLEDSPNHAKPGRYSVDGTRGAELGRVNGENTSSSTTTESGNHRKNGSNESEYKKGLRPVLWLSPDFPLKTEELQPLLDILANKVKAIRRLQELLTTKLPIGTFPVKVAIPVVPTIRVLVTFTKFEELQPPDEFSTPPMSPTAGYARTPSMAHPSTPASWFGWMKTPSHIRQNSFNGSRIENVQDPFAIPSDYPWITADAKKKRNQEKKRAKKAKGQQQRKNTALVL